MSNIKTEINAYIKQNGRQQITGSVLNGVLNHMVDYTDDSKPTKTSELTNDSGFLTEHQDISGKVDKVVGKGLSTNDFTNADKSKLDSIPSGAEANVQSDWNETDATKDSFIKNKPTIPSVPTDDINANTQARHTHSNKAILDAITSAPITEHQDISGKADKSYVDDKVGDVASKVGTLSDLETTAKNDLVSAINEVKQSGGTDASVREDLDAIKANMDNFGDVHCKSIDSDEIPMVCHYPMIVYGTAAPTITPDFIGQMYIDKTNGKVYVSTGVANASSFKVLN